MVSTSKILVLGAKFNVKIPDENFEKIYTANGAAILAKEYKNKYQNTYHTAVFGKEEFCKNLIVQKSVINSQPDKIFIRNGKINLTDYNFKKLNKYQSISSYDDMKLQLKFTNLNLFEFINAELKYKNSSKISYLFRCLKNFYFQGFSSGFFSMLLAILENPESKIFISGMGLNEGGGHFYTSANHKGFFSDNDKKKFSNNLYRNTNRKKVERYLFKNINQNILDRIVSLDHEISENTNIEYFNCNKTIHFSRNID